MRSSGKLGCSLPQRENIALGPLPGRSNYLASSTTVFEESPSPKMRITAFSSLASAQCTFLAELDHEGVATPCEARRGHEDVRT